MKHNFCLVLENIELPKVGNLKSPLIQTFEFTSSLTQAERVFYALSFALCFSICETITLFCGEKEILKCSFNHRDQIPTFTKVR